MDFMANKALMIGVGIFVTLAITSGVLMVINNIQLIYGQVYNTDTSITSQFSEFDKFDNGEFTGLEISNYMKKYKDNNLVSFRGVTTFSKANYGTIYTTTITQDKNGIYIITVSK